MSAATVEGRQQGDPAAALEMSDEARQQTEQQGGPAAHQRAAGVEQREEPRGAISRYRCGGVVLRQREEIVQ